MESSGNPPRPLTEADLPFLATKDDLRKVIRFFNKKLEKVDGLISDCFESIAAAENAEVEIADEAIEKANRAQRTANRVKKRLDLLEASLEDGEG